LADGDLVLGQSGQIGQIQLQRLAHQPIHAQPVGSRIQPRHTVEAVHQQRRRIHLIPAKLRHLALPLQQRFETLVQRLGGLPHLLAEAIESAPAQQQRSPTAVTQA
jgi:hypothetical protein